MIGGKKFANFRTEMYRTILGSIEVEVEMGRQILGMILTMYLPTTLMNIIGKLEYTSLNIDEKPSDLGHITNYMKRFFFEAQVKKVLKKLMNDLSITQG